MAGGSCNTICIFIIIEDGKSTIPNMRRKIKWKLRPITFQSLSSRTATVSPVREEVCNLCSMGIELVRSPSQVFFTYFQRTGGCDRKTHSQVYSYSTHPYFMQPKEFRVRVSRFPCGSITDLGIITRHLPRY